MEALRRQFALQYFRWAQRHTVDGDALTQMSLVSNGIAQATAAYLRQLDHCHRQAVMTAMIKRFHAHGAALAEEPLTASEQALLEEKDRIVLETGGMTRKSGERGLSAARFRAAFRVRAAGLGTLLDDTAGGAKIELILSGWRIRTVIAYSSEPVYTQVVITPTGTFLEDGISVLSWLGVSGQSVWHLAQRGREDETAHQVAEAAEIFVRSAGPLLPLSIY